MVRCVAPYLTATKNSLTTDFAEIAQIRKRRLKHLSEIQKGGTQIEYHISVEGFLLSEYVKVVLGEAMRLVPNILQQS